jgi:hypothetical protein
MLQPTKRDVDEAWQAWLEIDLAIPVQACEAANDALSPLTATRLIAHLRFSTMFCDYVLHNERQRIREISQLELLRCTQKRRRQKEEWLADWEPLPDSLAKAAARRQLAEAQRGLIELVCLRHLWLMSLAPKPCSIPRSGAPF